MLTNYRNLNLFQTIVLLNVTEDATLQEEGLAREVINRIQKLRKKVVTTESPME
jgi:hypothetical protein